MDEIILLTEGGGGSMGLSCTVSDTTRTSEVTLQKKGWKQCTCINVHFLSDNLSLTLGTG